MNPDAITTGAEVSFLAQLWAKLDPTTLPGTPEHTFWALVGLLAIVTFNGRFYVQWIYSERLGRSAVPIAFWYMSTFGGLIYLAFNAHIGSPNGTLNYSLNIIIFIRNLIHIWRERGVLTPRLNMAARIFAVIVGVTAAVIVTYTWYAEYHEIHREQPDAIAAAWFWIAVGTVGTALFGFRSILQWLISEAKRKSVVPHAYWYLSVAAALLQSVSFFKRGEWINFIGVTVSLPIYLRNIWLIRRGKPAALPSGD